MGADDGDVYMLRPDADVTDDDDDEETWVSPQPASEVIIETVAQAVDEESEDFDDLESYVDLEELADLFSGDEDESDSLTFDVEDYSVTVHRSGEIEVDE